VAKGAVNGQAIPSSYVGPYGLKSKPARPELNVDLRKSRSRKASGNCHGIQWNESAAPVNRPMQQPVRYIYREENPSGPQNAEYFPERAFLLAARSQMMQHQHRNRRRKTFLRERQSRSVTLQNTAVAVAIPSRQIRRKIVAVFQTCDPRG
jgi:hypothetical protein